MLKVVVLSIGMLTQPNDAALIGAMQKLTPVKVTDHLGTLLPLCAQFNIDLSEDDFKKQFAETLAIDAENMERFDAAWNAHIDLNSQALEKNLKTLAAYKAEHPDVKFKFTSNTNRIHWDYVSKKLAPFFAALNVDPEQDVFTTFAHQKTPVAVHEILFSELDNPEEAGVLLPDHSDVEIEPRRVKLYAQNEAIAEIAEKYGVRPIALECKLAEADLDSLLNKRKLRP